MKIVTVVGARPQFIKAAALSRVIRDSYSDKICEVLLHTGQHYDDNMSKVFFEELDIPRPKYNLEISGGLHGAMTGRMLAGIEDVLLQERPDLLLVYGDTNSTLAGALSAVKMHIPVAHIEAGLRSFNMRMPEEVNRILTDRVSSQLFCPTETAVNNLKSEGICQGVHNVGDVMYDASIFYSERARQKSNVLQKFGLQTGSFVLATCHRSENTDSPQRLASIINALARIANQLPVVLPLHPRTRKLIKDYGQENLLNKLIVTDPLPFLDMLLLEQSSRLILTDSGGVQKEAFFYGVPCLTMRDETEWVETVDLGWNQLVGSDTDLIVTMALKLIKDFASGGAIGKPYGDGNAAENIVNMLI